MNEGGSQAFAALRARYLDELEVQWTHKTLEHQRCGLQLFERYLAETEGALCRESVLGFARFLESQKRRRDGQAWALRTKHWPLLALRGLLKWALVRGFVLDDLSRLIEVRRVAPLPRALSEEQLTRMIERGCHGTFAVRDRAILEVFYGTGLRAAELSRLAVTDVALQEGLVYVRLGKGRKDRVVPLGERACEAVLAYLCERPAHPVALFLSRHERPLSTVMLWRLVKRAGLRAAVAGASPHRLRHSYATHLLRNGAALPELMTLLGHSSFQSTQIYTGVEVADLQRMIERSHPRGRA